MLTVVILAAGQGTRMKSNYPKVLHTIGDKAMLQHVIETAQLLLPSKIIVVHGFEKDTVQSAISTPNLIWVEQLKQIGTGDALSKALSHIDENNRVLTLYGDVPLISADTLNRLIHLTPSEGLGVITAVVNKPTGLGRIVRGAQQEVLRIVEEKEANDLERQIHEINTGIFLLPGKRLGSWLSALDNENEKGEYYLTDVVEMAVEQGLKITTVVPNDVEEISGVNDKSQLVQVERYFQKQLAEKFLRDGVWIADPSRFDLRGSLVVGKGVSIDVNVVFLGDNRLEDGVSIGPNCVIQNCTIGKDTQVNSNSVLEGTVTGKSCILGPFARTRPGTRLGTSSKVGNFVELKNVELGSESKANHLSYLGDAIVGKRVNIGAGVITCNFDGAYKHVTHIEDDVLIGSDTQLVAPVVVERGATIGAGSTLNQTAKAHNLTLTNQLNHRILPKWQRPTKKLKEKLLSAAEQK